MSILKFFRTREDCDDSKAEEEDDDWDNNDDEDGILRVTSLRIFSTPVSSVQDKTPTSDEMAENGESGTISVRKKK